MSAAVCFYGRRFRDGAMVTLSPGKRSHDEHLVAGREPAVEGALLLAVHEDLDVRADRVLLVDDAEADAGMAPVEVGEKLREGRAVRLDLAAVRGVVGERARQEDLQVMSAVSIE